jgi:hypothetical protein
MNNIKRKAIIWSVILSEGTHVFCCVLPTLFSIVSLLAGAGIVAVMPGFMVVIHDFLHQYEVPMIIVSAAILMLGWGLYFYSRKVDCHDTGCAHGPCGPKKDKVKILLIVATVLFVLNVSVYAAVHRDGGRFAPAISYDFAQEHDHAQ